MMRRRIGRLVVVAVIAAAVPLVARAVSIPNPTLLAVYYNNWMAQAYDECSSPVTGITPGHGYPRCTSSASDTVTFHLAKVIVSRAGKILLIGSGFPSHLQVQLRFDIRTSTRQAPLETFADTTITCNSTTCGNTGYCIQATALNNCTSGSGLSLIASHTNIEILGAELIEGPLGTNPGAVIARPGVVRP